MNLKLNEVVTYFDGTSEHTGVVRIVDMLTCKVVNEWVDINKKDSNFERMLKLCSDLSDIFKYPYYFNFSPPTNYRYRDDDDHDTTYFIIRVGKYIPDDYVKNGVEYTGRNKPVEKQIFFGLIGNISDGRVFNSCVWGINCRDDDKIKSLEDVKRYKDEIVAWIDSLFEKTC